MKDFKFFQKRPPTKWRQSNGVEVNIVDLTTRHIENIVDCLCGIGNVEIPEPYDGRTRYEWYLIFRNEFNIRRETF